MNKNLFRSIVWLLMIAFLLVLVLIKIDPVTSALGQFVSLLTPLFAGVMIALVLERPFDLFRALFLKIFKKAKRKHRLATGFSILVTYLLLAAFLAMFLLLVIPGLVNSISTLLANIGGYAENLEQSLNGIRESNDFLKRHLDPVDLSGWEQYLTEQLKQLGTYLSERLPQIFDITKSIVGGITDAVLTLMISIYILFDLDHLLWQAKKAVYALLPDRAAVRIHEVAKLSAKMFTNFISGRVVDSIVIGVICFICMSLFGFEYTALISVIVGVTNIIPVFGPFIGGIPSALLLLLVNPKDCFWFIVFIIILQQLDGNVIGPKIAGETTGLPTLWVVVALGVGGGLFGFWGLLLGVPFFAVIYSLIRQAVTHNAKQKELPLDDAPEGDPPKKKTKNLLKSAFNKLRAKLHTGKEKKE